MVETWWYVPPSSGELEPITRSTRRCSLGCGRTRGCSPWAFIAPFGLLVGLSPAARAASVSEDQPDWIDGGEWALSMDATVVRAHRHSAAARHAPPKDVPPSVVAPTVLD